MNKEQASKAYIKGKLRDHQEYLGCEEKRRKRLITCDLYDLEQAFEDGWDEAKKQIVENIKKSLNELNNQLSCCRPFVMVNTEAFIKSITSEVDYKSSAAYDGFLMGAKWADKTQIERVLNFMFKYFYEHPHVHAHICTDSFESLEELEEELLKAMEE